MAKRVLPSATNHKKGRLFYQQENRKLPRNLTFLHTAGSDDLKILSYSWE
uniref:Uncharacterized protein n=1 Tax=Arundo donax TaxID=35708 RepID=A0A0A8Y6X3_ARUDO